MIRSRSPELAELQKCRKETETGTTFEETGKTSLSMYDAADSVGEFSFELVFSLVDLSNSHLVRIVFLRDPRFSLP